MKTHIYDTKAEIGDVLADRILAGLRTANAAGRTYVLGCPGGRSPMPVYEALGRKLAAAPEDCSRIIIAMMDEYLLGDDPAALALPSPSAHFSCTGFGQREILGRINAGLPPSGRVPAENLWVPSPLDPAAQDGRLQDAGGVDLFLLASGAGDGHIAFNPPGSARDSKSRIVKLAEQTRRDNLATFPDFRGVDEVPRYGVTLGIDSIARASKAVAMIVWGEGKRQAFARLSKARAYEADWPATIVVECREPALYADRAAAGDAA